VAGSVGKTGAAALCSLAALRVGAGLVTLALPESLNDAMEAKLTEVMTVPLPETEERTLSRAALDRLLPLLEGKAAVALGPGLSTHPSTVALVWDLVAAARLPLVVDADGINALGSRLEALGKVTAPLVLTPHPGELSRLLTVGTQEVQDQRIPIAQKVAQTYNLTLVLKGARTVVASPKGQVAINPTGNPGMATAGSGDVLTGILAGLIAQGGDLELKTRAGVYLHGLAGDLAAEALTAEAMLAGDLLERLPEAIRRVKGAAPARSPSTG
jgi:NAD(P)H-hydrate epimerase